MRWTIIALGLLAAACGSDASGPVGPVRFVDRDINLGQGLSGQVQVVNGGSAALTGVSFQGGDAVNGDGEVVDGARVVVLSGVIGSLRPGRKLSFPITLEISAIPPGSYSISLAVLVDGEESDRAKIRFRKGAS